MDTDTFSILTISLFEGCEKSFVTALNLSGIPHGRVETFTSQSSPVLEIISTPTQEMPWNDLATIIYTWQRRRKGREIIITNQNKTTSPARDCTTLEIKMMLIDAVDIKVIAAKPTKNTVRVFMAT